MPRHTGRLRRNVEQQTSRRRPADVVAEQFPHLTTGKPMPKRFGKAVHTMPVYVTGGEW